MRSFALVLALLPLLGTGCKKKDTEEAASGPPPIQVQVPRASRAGDTATIYVAVTNNTGGALQVQTLQLSYTDYPDCKAKKSVGQKVAAGGELATSIDVSCEMDAYTGGQLAVSGSLGVETASGESRTRTFKQTVSLK